MELSLLIFAERFLLLLFFFFLPEEAVVLDADFPQPFGGAMILEFESHGALKLLSLSEITKHVKNGYTYMC